MVGVTAPIVAHDPANLSRNGFKIRNQRLNRFRFQVCFPGQCLVHVRDVGSMVLVMVDFHGLRVEVGFKRILRVR